jgi:hypothetical protein
VALTLSDRKNQKRSMGADKKNLTKENHTNKALKTKGYQSLDGFL